MSDHQSASVPDSRGGPAASGEAFSALLLFHFRVGVRLALLRLAPVAAALAVLLVFLRPGFFLLGVMELGRSGGPVLGAVSVLIGWGFAVRAAPRIVIGVRGWIRHLPLGDLVQRRAVQAGLWTAQLPVGLAMIGIYAWAGARFGGLEAAYPLGIPVMLWAAGTAALPLKNIGKLRWPVLAAGWLAASADWILLASGLVLLVLLDRIAGSLAPLRSRPPVRFSWLEAWLSYRILWRALRWRLGLAYLAAILPLIMTQVFMANNSETTIQTQRAQLFGTALAVVVFTALTANLMALRRPVWPWARSLPKSARHRVVDDALFLWFHGLPLWLPLLAWNASAWLVLLGSLPALALYAAASVRRAPDMKTGALGTVSLWGVLGGILITLIPAAGLVFVGALPLLQNHGRRIDRVQKVSRWLDYHHLAAGDSHTWSRE